MFLGKKVDSPAFANLLTEMRVIWKSGTKSTFERMNSLVAPPTHVHRVTVPIPVASMLELSPRVTGLCGLSEWYVVNHVQLQAMCNVAPELIMMLFFLMYLVQLTSKHESGWLSHERQMC